MNEYKKMEEKWSEVYEELNQAVKQSNEDGINFLDANELTQEKEKLHQIKVKYETVLESWMQMKTVDLDDLIDHDGRFLDVYEPAIDRLKKTLEAKKHEIKIQNYIKILDNLEKKMAGTYVMLHRQDPSKWETTELREVCGVLDEEMTAFREVLADATFTAIAEEKDTFKARKLQFKNMCELIMDLLEDEFEFNYQPEAFNYQSKYHKLYNDISMKRETFMKMESNETYNKMSNEYLVLNAVNIQEERDLQEAEGNNSSKENLDHSKPKEAKQFLLTDPGVSRLSREMKMKQNKPEDVAEPQLGNDELNKQHRASEENVEIKDNYDDHVHPTMNENQKRVKMVDSSTQRRHRKRCYSSLDVSPQVCNVKSKGRRQDKIQQTIHGTRPPEDENLSINDEQESRADYQA